MQPATVRSTRTSNRWCTSARICSDSSSTARARDRGSYRSPCKDTSDTRCGLGPCLGQADVIDDTRLAGVDPYHPERLHGCMRLALSSSLFFVLACGSAEPQAGDTP